MELHHQITGSHLEGQAKSSSFEREIKKPPHEAKRAFYSVPETRPGAGFGPAGGGPQRDFFDSPSTRSLRSLARGRSGSWHRCKEGSQKPRPSIVPGTGCTLDKSFDSS
jgi:hypothetical protein